MENPIVRAHVFGDSKIKIILETPIKDTLFCSYNEWRNRGRYVMQGEKATARTSDNVALFSKAQTKKNKKNDGSLTYSENFTCAADPDRIYGFDSIIAGLYPRG